MVLVCNFPTDAALRCFWKTQRARAERNTAQATSALLFEYRGRYTKADTFALERLHFSRKRVERRTFSNNYAKKTGQCGRFRPSKPHKAIERGPHDKHITEKAKGFEGRVSPADFALCCVANRR